MPTKTDTVAKKKKQISGRQVNAIVFRRLRKYNRLNFLESFAMFMGKTQLIELRLKGLLVNKYRLKEAKIENWPLGQVIAELKKRELRQDFVRLLEELKRHRNYIAHQVLADDAITRKVAGPRAQRFAWKSLNHGLHSIETVIVVHDFLTRNELL
jgi:hypothetical protein